MRFYKQKQIILAYLLLLSLMRISNIFCSMLEQYLSQNKGIEIELYEFMEKK